MNIYRPHDFEVLRKDAVELLSEAIADAEVAAHPLNSGRRKQASDSHAEALAAINALYVAGRDFDECANAAVRTLENAGGTWVGPGATVWQLPAGSLASVRDLVQGSKEQPEESLTAAVHRAGKRACGAVGGDPESKSGLTWVNGWMTVYLVFGGQDDGGDA